MNPYEKFYLVFAVTLFILNMGLAIYNLLPWLGGKPWIAVINTVAAVFVGYGFVNTLTGALA